jgi:hypothetical protein
VKKLALLLPILLSFNLRAVVHELAFDFGYDKQIYGTNRQNSMVNRSYSGGVSSYVFSTTAIDINFSYSKDITTEADRYNVATGIDLIGQQNRIESNVYGIGIKQMLLPRTFFVVPMISIGYARQFTYYTTDLTLEDTSSHARSIVTSGTAKQRIDSVFAAFILQFKMSERLSFKGSVKTLFPAFEYDEAKNNLKYSVGLSWYF